VSYDALFEYYHYDAGKMLSLKVKSSHITRLTIDTLFVRSHSRKRVSQKHGTFISIGR